MKKLPRTKANKAKRFREIISLTNEFGTTDWSANAASSSSTKDYRIVKKFSDVGLDVRLYLSDEGKIRLCLYSFDREPKKDVDILRKINIHPSTGAEFWNGGERDRDDANSYNLCHLVRHIDWCSMEEDDVVTLCADYSWLVAELHRIKALL